MFTSYTIMQLVAVIILISGFIVFLVWYWFAKDWRASWLNAVGSHRLKVNERLILDKNCIVYLIQRDDREHCICVGEGRCYVIEENVINHLPKITDKMMKNIQEAS